MIDDVILENGKTRTLMRVLQTLLEATILLGFLVLFGRRGGGGCWRYCLVLALVDPAVSGNGDDFSIFRRRQSRVSRCYVCRRRKFEGMALLLLQIMPVLLSTEKGPIRLTRVSFSRPFPQVLKAYGT